MGEAQCGTKTNQEKIMSSNAHISTLAGKTGRIYTARNGTVMVFVLENNEAWMASCINPTDVINKVVPEYWRHSIDWAGADYEYMVFGMTRDAEDKPHYPVAKKLTDE